jgi:hypothetical protein
MRRVMQRGGVWAAVTVVVLVSGASGVAASDNITEETIPGERTGERLPSNANTGERAADQLPPNARPGECYARIYLPPVYGTRTEQVVKRAASERVQVIPARFETVEEKVLVREASKRMEIVPATYETVEETIVVKPASATLREVPAEYETVSEQVLEKEGYTYWKKGTGPIQKVDRSTGEIMCLVEVAPVYRTVSKKVVKTPAHTEEIAVPEVTQTVKKQVMKTPPTPVEIEVPGEYKMVKVAKLVEPAREVRQEIPAEYQTINVAVKLQEGRHEWRPILCETNMTKAKIMSIQRALRDAGYNPGKIDGKWAHDTIAALNKFQKAKQLPVDEYVNLDTARALKVGF